MTGQLPPPTAPTETKGREKVNVSEGTRKVSQCTEIYGRCMITRGAKVEVESEERVRGLVLWVYR